MPLATRYNTNDPLISRYWAAGCYVYKIYELLIPCGLFHRTWEEKLGPGGTHPARDFNSMGLLYVGGQDHVRRHQET